MSPKIYVTVLTKSHMLNWNVIPVISVDSVGCQNMNFNFVRSLIHKKKSDKNSNNQSQLEVMLFHIILFPGKLK